MFGIYIVLGMVIVGAISLVFFYHQKRLKMTSVTAGRIVRSEQREVRDDKERRDETVIVCTFQVAGRERSIEQVVRGRQAARFPVGRTLSVYYNPSDPEMSRIDLS